MAVEEDYYSVLGVSRDATLEQVRKEFKVRALKAHPDKGGSSEEFQRLQEAYATLSDPDKRAAYDRYGKEGVQGGAGGGMDPRFWDEMFADFMFNGGDGDIPMGCFGFDDFGSSSQRRGSRKRRAPPAKGPDHQQGLVVSLEELYMGKTHTFHLERDVLCGSCEGYKTKGGKTRGRRSCAACSGTGSVRVARGPFVHIAVCEKCGGDGEVIIPKFKCTKCAGSGIVQKTEVITVNVLPGMQDGNRIAIEKMSDWIGPESEPGDIIINLKQKPHKIYTRVGDDLCVSITLTLKEALCGFKRSFDRLDGCSAFTFTHRGAVLQSGAELVVPNEGMPHLTSSRRGNLIVHVTIDPRSATIPPDVVTYLEEKLPDVETKGLGTKTAKKPDRNALKAKVKAVTCRCESDSDNSNRRQNQSAGQSGRDEGRECVIQ